LINNRGILVTFLAIAFITMIVMGFADRLKPVHCDITKIDNCARTGGLSR
jgi:hypothetical protein